MERVTFLIERSGTRISCLLNPEALETRRLAGLVRRAGQGGSLGQAPRSDDPLLAIGGGITEYELKLLFDVDIANEATAAARQSSPDGRPSAADDAPRVRDVRSCTQPLWALAETGDQEGGPLTPPRVRFIWGKSWNVPGVVTAVAERLERFDANGAPQRSWLSLRLQRVQEDSEPGEPAPAPVTPHFENGADPSFLQPSSDESVMVMRDEDGLPQVRHDTLGYGVTRNPSRGLEILDQNGIDDPFDIPDMTRLNVSLRALPSGQA